MQAAPTRVELQSGINSRDHFGPSCELQTSGIAMLLVLFGVLWLVGVATACRIVTAAAEDSVHALGVGMGVAALVFPLLPVLLLLYGADYEQLLLLVIGADVVSLVLCLTDAYALYATREEYTRRCRTKLHASVQEQIAQQLTSPIEKVLQLLRRSVQGSATGSARAAVEEALHMLEGWSESGYVSRLPPSHTRSSRACTCSMHIMHMQHARTYPTLVLTQTSHTDHRPCMVLMSGADERC